MLSFVSLILSCLLVWFTKEGIRIWAMCLFVALTVHECGTFVRDSRAAQDGRVAYITGFEICKKADFPDVIILKHYQPNDGHTDFMYFCVDSRGGLHISPDVASKPINWTQNSASTPLPSASTLVSP